MEHVVLSPTQKALQINLDPNIYGTFVEIGAGQEVVRHFFRAGVPQEPLQKPCRHTIGILVMLFMEKKTQEDMFASHA